MLDKKIEKSNSFIGYMDVFILYNSFFEFLFISIFDTDDVISPKNILGLSV